MVGVRQAEGSDLAARAMEPRPTSIRLREEERTYRVLLVEDDPLDARLAQQHLAQLQRFPHVLTTVGTLGEAMAVLARGGIDVVLLDLGLPDSQGLGTLSRVVTEQPDVPVVVFTGNADEEVAFAAARMGAQDYVVKGQTRGVLQHVLRYAVERHAILRSGNLLRGLART